MKPALLVLALAAGVPASAMDIDKDIFQTAVLGADLQPAWTNTINDLLPDPAFGGGNRTFVFDDADGKTESSLRVFPASGSGYWVAGWHGNLLTAPRFLAIARLNADGSYDTTWGDAGKKTIATTMLSVVDVAKGADDTLYFVGTRHTGSATDLDIQIDCVDNGGNPCSGFGTNGVKGIWLDLGSDDSNHDDVPYRIVWFASQLYVVGETDTGAGAAKNKAAFAINLNPSSGDRNMSFGNVPAHPGVFVYNPDITPNGRDAAYGALAYSPSPFAYRLILVGERQQEPGDADTDGFVLSIDGVTGEADGFIDDNVFGDLGTKKQDRVTHVLQRHNGGFVVAGVATDDSESPPRRELLMASYKADGALDYAFGEQANMSHALVVSGSNVPYGLAERADTRDLVVGLDINDDLGGDGHAMQAVVQFGRHHIFPLHALSVLDFAAFTPADKGSWGSDLFLDESNRVVTAGTRCWKRQQVGMFLLCTDQDMTGARFIATDTIFASHFGRPDSD